MELRLSVSLAALAVVLTVAAAVFEYVARRRRRLGHPSRPGAAKRLTALIGVLVLLVLGQFVLFLHRTPGAPPDCAEGRLRIIGSSAFAPVVREAVDAYSTRCPRAALEVDMRGDGLGLEALTQIPGPDGSAGLLTFTEGEPPEATSELVGRPIALVLFTFVANAEAGVNDLTTEQIRRIYRGEVANWRDVGGNDMPVRLVSQNPGAGARTALQHRVLAGFREPGTNSDDCQTRDPSTPPGIIRCSRASTDAVLETVADTSGGLGYADLNATTGWTDLTPVLINGEAVTLANADRGNYPYWATEYGFTRGAPAARSLTASFLRYLTGHDGAAITRADGGHPCTDIGNTELCPRI